MKIIENFNRQFHYVPGLKPLSNFPKIIPLFLLIFERNPEKKLIRAGVKWFFKINLSLIDVMLKKWGKKFFSPEPEVTKI